MKKRYETAPLRQARERAYLVGVSLPRSSIAREREYLDELEQLAATAGATVVGTTVQARTRLDGATFVGTGKAQAIKEECEQLGANLLIVNNDLSPAQSRNLEKILNINIIDRTELILDIFAKHAQTRQARIQVELAQLAYLLPRLRKLWDHLSRQAGGIGTRGPGETQLEVDRRRVDARITHLKLQLKKFERRKDTVRKSRGDYPIVAIVGYTNAGKSTLMNALTGADTLVQDRLFATLDTTTRKLAASKNSGSRDPILMVDTVGFIRRLPHHLIESFKATLGDIANADLYLHVVDVSHSAFLEQMEITDVTLRTIENPGVKTIHIFNKIDRVEEEFAAGVAHRYPDALFVSAAQRRGVEELKNRVEEFFFGRMMSVEVKLPATNGKAIAKAKSLLRDSRGRMRGTYFVLRGMVESRNISQLENLDGARVKCMP
ncbi:MAG: GTPase HflX [Chitinivibrionia bacterium]|nr:GTPase HflX [Chitinivibrionia bacterium]